MKARGFSYRRVVRRRDALVARAMRPYIAAKLVGETIGDLCDDMMAEMPPTVSRDALFESLRVFAGDQMSRRTAFELAWRLSGNIDLLIEGRPVLPWARQLRNEIVPVRVEYMRPEKRKDSAGYVLYCRALAGSPCPMIFPKFFSKRSCNAIARTLGFSAPWGLYPFKDPMYFVNLMFFAHIEAEKSKETPFFHEISCSAGLKSENKPRIEVRTRAKPCPQRFKHQCAQCPIGYDTCPAGIHPKSLVKRACTKCCSDGFFDPNDEESQTCMNCRFSHATEKV